MRKFDNFVDFDPMFSTIRNLEDITPNEKILLSKIISFYINEKKCTSSNGWFATRLSVKKNTVSTMINNLFKKEYITCSYYFDPNNQAKKRWIKITQKTINLITKNTQLQKEQQPTEYKYDINSLVKKMEKEAMEEYGFFGNDNKEIASEIDF
jgi:DNA-binding MarR family transcriptional regulator